MRAFAWHPGYVLLGLVAALPLIAVTPLASRLPQIAVTASPVYLYTVGLLLCFAAWIWRQDVWLGALAAWVSVTLLWTPTVHAFEITETIVMSLVALTILRTMPASALPIFRHVLVGIGLFEVADGLQQWMGYDVLWNGTRPITPIPSIFGTTGNSNYYGVFLAMIAPLAPWWAVPFLLVGIYLSHSMLGALAVGVALCWRVRERRELAVGMALAMAVVFIEVMVWKGEHAFSGLHHRLAVWQLAWNHLTWPGVLLGAGPGNWMQHIPALQVQANIYPREVFLQGHNEWFQLLYENGVLAVSLVLGWLWSQRKAFTGEYGPALLSVMICSVGMFGLHLAMTGCVALVILGLATRQEAQI
jgi:hypothetical protein